jgi:hypothetical protein
MHMGRTGVVLAGVVLATMILAACGSGDGGNNSAAPTERPPQELPTVTGDAVTFPAKGYALTIPAGWTYEPNVTRSETISPDLLISQETIDDVQASVTITCERVPADISDFTLANFFDNKAERAQTVGATDLAEDEERTIAGVPARVLRYNRVVDPTTIARQDFLFLHGDCAWQLAFTSAPSATETLQPTIDALVSSFQFVD